MVVGFTPATLPDGTPPQLADPIEGAAQWSSGFVANVTNTQADSGATAEPTQTPSEESTQTEIQDSASTNNGLATAELNVTRLEMLIHQRVNEERESRNLGSLSFDSALQEIARYHSEGMAQNDYFAHTAPDGETMEDRYDSFGYQCRVSVGENRYVTGAENLFTLSYSGMEYSEEEIAAETVLGWLGSSSHRENMLREYWNQEGIGVSVEREEGETKVYVTQNFC